MGHQGVGRRSIAKKKYKIKRAGASKGWWRVDCKKKCKIKRVGALRGRLRKKCKIKRVGSLRGRLQKKCKIERVGVLRGGWRVDGGSPKKVQN